jgi:hypothetical protein
MSAWTVLPSVHDQQIAQNIIAAAKVVLEAVDRRVDPDHCELRERGVFNYIVDASRVGAPSYTLTILNIERTVLPILALARIVQQQPRHIQQISVLAQPPAPVTDPTGATLSVEVSYARIYVIHIDVFYDAQIREPSDSLHTPMFDATLIRVSAAREALLQFANEHRIQPRANVPLLHNAFDTQHIPVLAPIIEIMQNSKVHLERIDWYIVPDGDLSSRYKIVAWNVRSFNYSTLEYLYMHSGNAIRDIRFEQTFDDALAVLVIDVDVEAVGKALIGGGAIAFRQRVHTPWSRGISNATANQADGDDNASVMRKRMKT